MALQPARTKFRRAQKGSNAGKAKRGNTIAFGEYAIQAMDRVRLDGRQIEAARVGWAIGADQASAVNRQHHWQVLQRDVVNQLVVSAL